MPENRDIESGAVTMVQEEIAGATVRAIAAVIPIPEGAEPDYAYLIVRAVEVMARRAQAVGRVLDGEPAIEGPVDQGTVPETMRCPGMDIYRITSGTVQA
jgi:hypothetical protein